MHYDRSSAHQPCLESTEVLYAVLRNEQSSRTTKIGTVPGNQPLSPAVKPWLGNTILPALVRTWIEETQQREGITLNVRRPSADTVRLQIATISQGFCQTPACHRTTNSSRQKHSEQVRSVTSLADNSRNILRPILDRFHARRYWRRSKGVTVASSLQDGLRLGVGGSIGQRNVSVAICDALVTKQCYRC